MASKGKVPASLQHLLPGKQVTIKPKKRFRPGTVALREIKKYQRSTDTFIPRAAMKRLIKSVAYDQALGNGVEIKQGIRVTEQASTAIHEFIESQVVSLMEDALLNTLHAKRVTTTPKDMQLARRIRGERELV